MYNDIGSLTLGIGSLIYDNMIPLILGFIMTLIFIWIARAIISGLLDTIGLRVAALPIITTFVILPFMVYQWPDYKDSSIYPFVMGSLFAYLTITSLFLLGIVCLGIGVLPTYILYKLSSGR